MLKCHLNQWPHLHGTGELGVCACAADGVGWNRMHMWRGDCCQQETVFSCIDYGWKKQTLVWAVYPETTASK